MNEWLMLGLGLVAGAVAVWVWTAARSKAAQIEAEGRVRAAESRVAELRAQTDRFDKEVSSLSDKLRVEVESRERTQVHLGHGDAVPGHPDEAGQPLFPCFDQCAHRSLVAERGLPLGGVHQTVKLEEVDFVDAQPLERSM